MKTMLECWSYRVTIGDPIVSGPGQEWDQEWAVPQRADTDRCCKERNATLFSRALLSEKYAVAPNKQTCDLDSYNLLCTDVKKGLLKKLIFQ